MSENEKKRVRKNNIIALLLMVVYVAIGIALNHCDKNTMQVPILWSALLLAMGNGAYFMGWNSSIFVATKERESIAFCIVQITYIIVMFAVPIALMRNQFIQLVHLLFS